MSDDSRTIEVPEGQFKGKINFGENDLYILLFAIALTVLVWSWSFPPRQFLLTI